jgi:hypothetical protein
MRRTWALAAMLVILASNSTRAGTEPPEAGRYVANILVSEVVGAECPDRTGDQYVGVVHYQGFNGDGLTIRIPVTFDGRAVIDEQRLRTIAGRGTVNPSGSFRAHLTRVNITITGTFEATLTLDDREAFTAQVVESAPEISCTEVFQIGLVRSG